MKYEILLNDLLKNAYSPYYNFKVACVIEMKDGSICTGVNLETALCSSICAERNAIAQGITKGYTKGDFKTLYLKGENNKEFYPCFICRQYMVEFFEEDTKIISIHEGIETMVTLKDLTPLGFGPKDIKEK